MSANPSVPAVQGSRAGLLILSAMALIGFIDSFVPLIAKEAGLWQFHLLRSAIAVPTSLGLGVMLGWRLRPLRWRAVLWRSLAITASMVVYFGGLGILPVAQVAAGLFTGPIFILLIAVVVLRRPIGPWRILAVALGFVGVLTVLNPFAEGAGIDVLIPVLAGVFYAIGNTLTRETCSEEGPVALLVAFFLCIGLVAVLGLSASTLLSSELRASLSAEVTFLVQPWVPPSAIFLGLMAMQAVGSMLAVGMIIRAYQIGDPSRVSVYEFSLLVFLALWAWVLWGQTITLREAVGMAMIAFAGAVIAMREGRRK